MILALLKLLDALVNMLRGVHFTSVDVRLRIPRQDEPASQARDMPKILQVRMLLAVLTLLGGTGHPA